MVEPRDDSAWWDASWSPISGCLPNGPGCRYCYAPRAIAHVIGGGRDLGDAGAEPPFAPGFRESVLHRGVIDIVKGIPTFNGKLHTAAPGSHLWDYPLKYPGAERPLLGVGAPSLIFTTTMGDVFVAGRDGRGRPQHVIDRVLATLAASRHIGLIPSSYSERAAEYFGALDPRTVRRWAPQIWPGFSAADQPEFDSRWAAMKPLTAHFFVFVSIAPMIGPLVLPGDFVALGPRTWVICSGEQGPHHRCRDMDVAWAQALRDQCRAAGIPFFMKQRAKLKPIPPDLWLQQVP
jgi:protein gp37